MSLTREKSIRRQQDALAQILHDRLNKLPMTASHFGNSSNTLKTFCWLIFPAFHIAPDCMRSTMKGGKLPNMLHGMVLLMYQLESHALRKTSRMDINLHMLLDKLDEFLTRRGIFQSHLHFASNQITLKPGLRVSNPVKTRDP
ncbi:MAG: hypothetical protein P8Z72_07745 [Gammaproteobacteria bacterium]